MAKVFFWKEAEKDYKKLDGMLKQWVDAAGERLRIRGSEIGKDLGNTTYSKLAGFKELKNQKLGIRLIFKPTTDNQIEIIEIVAIGKREEEKVFLTAEKRRKKHLWNWNLLCIKLKTKNTVSRKWFISGHYFFGMFSL